MNATQPVYEAPPVPELVASIAQREGFCRVRGVFPATRISELESEVGRIAERFSPRFPDLYSLPEINWVMQDERVTAIARALLGPRPVYYRETSISFEQQRGPITWNPYTEFHCDARGNPNNLYGPWQGAEDQIYGAYRFALYFRDYQDSSGGLKVAPRSHIGPWRSFREYAFPARLQQAPKTVIRTPVGEITAPVPPFPVYNVPSAPGDIVVFNLRTFHSAGAVRFKGAPGVAVLPAVEHEIRGWPNADAFICPIPDGCRNALFFDFCAPTIEADLYIKWRAIVSSASLDTGLPVNTAEFPGMECRNDKLILALGRQILDRTNTSNQRDAIRMARTFDDLPMNVRHQCERLVGLGVTHQEFSPHFSFFNKTAFGAHPDSDPLRALNVILDGIEIVIPKVEGAKFDKGA